MPKNTWSIPAFWTSGKDEPAAVSVERRERPAAVAPASAEADPDTVEALLKRMRRGGPGGREAAALFITRYGSRIRRRIRGKIGTSMRRLFDSQEILSTVGRRLDRFVHTGQLRAEGADSLWALVCKIAENALIEKARVFRRLQEVEGSDGAFAAGLLVHLRRSDRDGSDIELEIDKVLRSLPEPVDREILSLWLAGHGHDVIGSLLGVDAATVRQRWRRIRIRLRGLIEDGELE